MKVLVLFSSGLAAIAAGVLAALLLVAPAASSNSVTLCHLADGPAKAGLISVAPAAAYNGHYLQHSADVIPPFEYKGETYSLNWTGSFPEECVPVTGTDTGGTTTEPPVTTTDEEPPCEETLAGQMLGCGEPPVDPPRDVCANLGGVQHTIPVGYIFKGRLCVPVDDPPVKHNDPPGTEIGDCVVQANRELLCGEQG